jgi:hypothetical protein
MNQDLDRVLRPPEIFGGFRYSKESLSLCFLGNPLVQASLEAGSNLFEILI